jgi:adenosylmethionine-8-amino-7-oxononanoate aminotransferase
MSDFIILGTDTDAGKTTFALLWLQRYADRWEYWKPVETGPSDSALVGKLAPAAVVHPSVRRFQAPVAPPLAAAREGASIPAAREVAEQCPRTLNEDRALVIETFGSPFSPLNDGELQIALIRAFDRPCVLVSSSALGCVGRTLQCLQALRVDGIEAIAVVLIGPRDLFAEQKIKQHAATTVIALEPPTEWTAVALHDCSERQRDELERLRICLDRPRVDPEQARRLQPDDRLSVWHPYTSLLEPDEPLACVGARDEFLELADGRRVIDGISSWWTILHGHRPPFLMEALAEAARRIDHVLFAGVTHSFAVELAELLLGTMPWCGGRVFFSDNGSTAVEVALKMAYQSWCQRGQPQRTRFVGFEHGYHGDTFGAMAVSRDPVFFGRFEPLLFQADILPLEPGPLDEHLQRHGNRTAAVILEPLVQGAGGMRMHTPALLRQLVEVARRHGVLFIADEVMTGGGRTGTLWAHQAAGVTPDLLCTAKTLAGGILPLAATLASPHIVEAFRSPEPGQTFFHGHSFTAHPLACAVALCNLRQLIARPSDAPGRFEAFWRHTLLPLQGHRRVKDVRIRGSIAAVEIDVPGGYLADVGRAMRRICLSRGVLLRPLGAVLYAMPPYCTSADSLQQIADAMRMAVDSLD